MMTLDMRPSFAASNQGYVRLVDPESVRDVPLSTPGRSNLADLVIGEDSQAVAAFLVAIGCVLGTGAFGQMRGIATGSVVAAMHALKAKENRPTQLQHQDEAMGAPRASVEAKQAVAAATFRPRPLPTRPVIGAFLYLRPEPRRQPGQSLGQSLDVDGIHPMERKHRYRHVKN